MSIRKPRDLLTQSWESEANFSQFLLLLNLLVFVFPTLGIGVKHVALYSDMASLSFWSLAPGLPGETANYSC